MTSQLCRPELKTWDMSSADYDVETYAPEDPDCFEVWITAHIGVVDEEGADLFQFRATTPSFLERSLGKGEPQWMRHTLLVARYDPTAIRNALVEHLATIDGQDWNEVGLKVGRIASWEFEDYVPFEGSPP